MGKKGKAQTNGKPKPKNAEDAEFDLLMSQLSEATSKNTAAPKQKQLTPKELKKERKEKLESIKKEKQEQQQRELQQRQQMAELLDFLRKQQTYSDFLEKANTEKETEVSENEELMVSSVAMQGWRRSMEDAHIIEKELENDGEKLSVFAVFDGHSGAEVAQYAAENLLQKLKEQEGWKEKDYEKALKAGFMALDQELKQKELQAGSTATVCLLSKEKIYCANAGDSRAVLCKEGKAVALSEDHKPNAEEEQQRIEKAGSTVSLNGGVARVNGALAVSRGFGDFVFKGADDIPPEEQAVTAYPDVTVTDRAGAQFLIVACDGIWDCIGNEEIVEQTSGSVLAATEPQHLAETTAQLFDKIVSATPGMIGSDNMSMVLVKFK